MALYGLPPVATEMSPKNEAALGAFRKALVCAYSDIVL
jgi:hypothetical protein